MITAYPEFYRGRAVMITAGLGFIGNRQGFIGWFIRLAIEGRPLQIYGDIGSFYADSSKFKHATGWTPTVALTDGLRRTIDFYRQHYRRYVPAASETERPQPA
jgi:nucleoside-diphosphate-sugar epimerase